MMTNNTLTVEDVCKKILSASYPVIVMHCRPDADTLGSAVALAKIFGRLGKRAICICADRMPKRLEFMCEGFVADNYTITADNTVICVDVASREQLGGLKEGISPAFAIDHHESGTPFTDTLVVGSAAACGEIIYDIARTLTAMGKLGGIDREVANSLYAAISSDTGCFKYSNTTPKTHRAAAKLLEAGAEADKINHLLFDSKDIKQLRAEAITLKNLEVLDNGKVAISTITDREKVEAGIESEYFETAIDVVRSLSGVEVAVTIKENSKGSFKASLRSTGRNVAEIAEKFGGGGHLRASGCTVEASDMEQAKAKLLAIILPNP